MTRAEIITEIKKYFEVAELVCPHTFERFGDNSWQFLSTEILHTLLILRRDVLRVPMVLNTYSKGGTVTDRGLLCNCCKEVADKTKLGVNYIPAQLLGNGFKCVFKAGSYDGQTARLIIKENAFRLPYPIRLKEGISWLQVDCLHTGTNKKITCF